MIAILFISACVAIGACVAALLIAYATPLTWKDLADASRELRSPSSESSVMQWLRVRLPQRNRTLHAAEALAVAGTLLHARRAARCALAELTAQCHGLHTRRTANPNHFADAAIRELNEEIGSLQLTIDTAAGDILYGLRVRAERGVRAIREHGDTLWTLDGRLLEARGLLAKAQACATDESLQMALLELATQLARIECMQISLLRPESLDAIEYALAEITALLQSSIAACTIPSTHEDPWSVLGLTPGASRDAIKTAYRQRMKQYHPDTIAARIALISEDPEVCERVRNWFEDETRRFNDAYTTLMEEASCQS